MSKKVTIELGEKPPLPERTTVIDPEVEQHSYYNVSNAPSEMDPNPTYSIDLAAALQNPPPGEQQPLSAGRKTKRMKRSTGKQSPSDLHYTVEDVPPWYMCILLGFQHYLVMFGATVANPLVMAPFLCIEHNDIAKSEIIGTIFVVAGIATLIQCTLGVRLPIVQGGTFTFVTPSIAILTLPRWKCPESDTTTVGPEGVVSETVTALLNATMNSLNDTSPGDETDPEWKTRMREIQGAIIVASLFHVVIGFTGLMGFMMRFIGPLSISPTISLAGLALFDVAATFSSKQWWITLITVVLIVAFSQYTKNVDIPCFTFRGGGCHRIKFPLFRLFPVILAISISWIICAILTATNVLPSDPNEWGYGATTTLRMSVLESAPWFRFPYPGQWGWPTFSAASIFGMLAGVLASMVESIGDYFACARMSGVPPPPMHAVNRGVGMEGLACVLAGTFGSGSGTTSYSENIGVIGITKVASRRVIQCSAITMIVFGVFGKFGAIFVTIPDPIVGGVFIVMFGMITAVGISNLQFVDLNSSRNLFIIGFSFFFGLTLPKYLSDNPDAIKTGNEAINQILTVLLKTSMFVGGLAGFVLDNTIPGTDEERGIKKWRVHFTGRMRLDSTTYTKPEQIYDIPFLTKYLQRWKWTAYVPFFPTFKEEIFRLPKALKKKKKKRNRSTPRQDAV